MTPLEVAPKAGRNVLESLGVAVLVAFVGSLMVRFGKGGTWTEVLVISGAAAVVAFFFYSLRFMRAGIKHLRLHDEGIDATMRNGKALRLVWARLKEVTLTDDYGGCWRIRYSGGELLLRDDGFSVDAWDEMSARIKHEMAKVGMPTAVEGIQSMFGSDDDDEDHHAQGDDWVTPWTEAEDSREA